MRSVGQSIVDYLCEGRRDYFSKVVLVTPVMAGELLEYHNQRNRQFYEQRAEFYAEEIRKGFWLNTSGSIGIDVLQQLTNGQHRLGGVVRSEMAVELPMVFNCDKDARAKEDAGKGRSEADRLSLSGTEASKSIVAAAKAFMTMPAEKSTKTSIEVLRACLTEFGDYITFARGLCISDKGGMNHAVIIAAIARASIHVGQSRMEEFVNVARSGVAETPEDQAAAMFAKWAAGNHLRAGGCGMRPMLYRYTQSALRAFIERRSLGKLYAAEGDLFPLPGEFRQKLGI